MMKGRGRMFVQILGLQLGLWLQVSNALLVDKQNAIKEPSIEEVFATLLVGVDVADDRQLLPISLKYWKALGVKPRNIVVTMNGQSRNSSNWHSVHEACLEAGVPAANLLPWEGPYNNILQKKYVSQMMHVIQGRIQHNDPSKVWIMQADVDEFPVFDAPLKDAQASAVQEATHGMEGKLVQKLLDLAQKGFNALPGALVDRVANDGRFYEPENKADPFSILEQFPITCNIVRRVTENRTASSKNVGFTADLLPKVLASQGGGHHLRELSGDGSTARCPPLDGNVVEVEVAHIRFTASAIAKNKLKMDLYRKLGKDEPDYRNLDEYLQQHDGMVDLEDCKGYGRPTLNEKEIKLACCSVQDHAKKAACNADYEKNFEELHNWRMKR